LRRGRRPKWMLEIARERIDILFKLADQEFNQHPERANRYVKLARNIGKLQKSIILEYPESGEGDSVKIVICS